MPHKLTKEDFIIKAREVHGNKYDYSKVEYINSITKVCIICPKHGEFFVTPSDHIHARVGCKKCSGRYKNTSEEFIQKAMLKYGNKYDYSKVEYVNNKTKVCIICHEKDEFGEEHGEFWQRPNDHLTGYECPKCKNEYKPTTEEWVKRAQKIHGNKYDYSKVEYKNANTKVCIICPEHGEFWQKPLNHIFNKSGCPQCNSDNKSKMEENIHIMLSENNILHERQKTFEWLKHKRHMYLDFYLPQYNIAIEVQGEQHFRPVKRFGGNDFYLLQKDRDTSKEILCRKNGVKLFYITKRNYNLEEILNYINNGAAE